MSVWGIGAMWSRVDVSKKFIENATAAIGWSKTEKPAYHALMKTVEVGDLIFIKARFMMNDPLRIKAVGIVEDSTLCEENGYDGGEGIRVRWLRDLTDAPVDITAPTEAGSTHTLYREKDPDVIRQIINLL